MPSSENFNPLVPKFCHYQFVLNMRLFHENKLFVYRFLFPSKTVVSISCFKKAWGSIEPTVPTLNTPLMLNLCSWVTYLTYP